LLQRGMDKEALVGRGCCQAWHCPAMCVYWSDVEPRRLHSRLLSASCRSERHCCNTRTYHAVPGLQQSAYERQRSAQSRLPRPWRGCSRADVRLDVAYRVRASMLAVLRFASALADTL
jgi:hypothetical protein